MQTKTMRTILFNVLVILTIIFIYFMFFPKKSYVEEKLNLTLNPIIEETFNQNINSMAIASTKYFEENEKTKVTLSELIKNNLLVELKDSNNEICDVNESYSEKSNSKLSIYLKCNDKEDLVVKKIKNEENKLFCLYQYEKKEPLGYTEWGAWSDWQEEKVEANELTNVETKIEKELDGTKTVTDNKQVSIDATLKTRISCPTGYSAEGTKCKKRVESKSITASISYSCPPGYTRNGTMCYSKDNTKEATKKYYCPTNQTNIEYELSGSTCKVYMLRYKEATKKESYYACPNNYQLSNNKCYKTETYEKEIDNYKEVTYYRYQTREKKAEKNVIKWSRPNDNNLLNDEYNMTIEVFCEF